MVLLDCMVCEARFTCRWRRGGPQGSFFNYVDKTRQVGGCGNVNNMYVFVYIIKGIPLLINVNSWVDRWLENAQILSPQFVNDPWPKNLCNVVVSGPQIICIWQAHLQLWQDTKVKSFGLSPTYCAVTQCNSILIWRNF